MNLAVVVVTDGRGDLLTQMLESASTNIDGFHDNVGIVGADDSGDPSYAQWLDEAYPMIVWHHHGERQGLAAAIRTAWEALAWKSLDWGDVDYVLHLEDDLEFPKPIDLGAWMDPFRYEPMLAQVCLQRGPQAPTEIEAGGILRLYEQTHPISKQYLGGRSWTEQTKLFSLQPNIYPSWVVDVGWPEHGGETEFTAKLLAEHPEARFAYLGHPDDEPHYEHPGFARRQAGWTV